MGNPEEFEEFMAEQNESDRIARGGDKSTMWKGSQIPRWLWILALVMGLYAMWSLIAVDGATSIVQSAFKAGVTTEDDWACSMQTEEIQSKASRHTTVRHKPKTRLNNKDKRKNESGEQTVSRVRKKMWVSRFKYRIKLAPGRFELGATPCPTHVGGHLDQLWNSNKSYLSISLRVQDTFLK